MVDIIANLDKLTVSRHDGAEGDKVFLQVPHLSIIMNNDDVEIKVGNNKVKVSILEFMVAFKDMLDTGVFEMDQIDSEVWDIENKLEVLGNQNDYLNETLAEIRGVTNA